MSAPSDGRMRSMHVNEAKARELSDCEEDPKPNANIASGKKTLNSVPSADPKENRSIQFTSPEKNKIPEKNLHIPKKIQRATQIATEVVAAAVANDRQASALKTLQKVATDALKSKSKPSLNASKIAQQIVEDRALAMELDKAEGNHSPKYGSDKNEWKTAGKKKSSAQSKATTTAKTTTQQRARDSPRHKQSTFSKQSMRSAPQQRQSAALPAPVSRPSSNRLAGVSSDAKSSALTTSGYSAYDTLKSSVLYKASARTVAEAAYCLFIRLQQRPKKTWRDYDWKLSLTSEERQEIDLMSSRDTYVQTVYQDFYVAWDLRRVDDVEKIATLMVQWIRVERLGFEEFTRRMQGMSFIPDEKMVAPPQQTVAPSAMDFLNALRGTPTSATDDHDMDIQDSLDDEMKAFVDICTKEYASTSSLRAMTFDEKAAFDRWIDGSLPLPFPPRFLKRCCTAREIALFVDYVNERVESCLVAKLPPNMPLPQTMSHDGIMRLITGGTDMAPALKEEIRLFRQAVQRTEYSYTTRTISFFFGYKRDVSAWVWPAWQMPFKERPINLINIRDPSIQTGDDGMPNAILTSTYSFTINSTGAQVTMSDLIGLLEDHLQLSVLSLEREIIDNRMRNPNRWCVVVNSSGCPPVLDGKTHFRWKSQLLQIHHVELFTNPPCYRCYSSRHLAQECSDTSKTKLLDNVIVLGDAESRSFSFQAELDALAQSEDVLQHVREQAALQHSELTNMRLHDVNAAVQSEPSTKSTQPPVVSSLSSTQQAGQSNSAVQNNGKTTEEGASRSGAAQISRADVAVGASSTTAKQPPSQADTPNKATQPLASKSPQSVNSQQTANLPFQPDPSKGDALPNAQSNQVQSSGVEDSRTDQTQHNEQESEQSQQPDLDVHMDSGSELDQDDTFSAEARGAKRDRTARSRGDSAAMPLKFSKRGVVIPSLKPARKSRKKVQNKMGMNSRKASAHQTPQELYSHLQSQASGASNATSAVRESWREFLTTTPDELQAASVTDIISQLRLWIAPTPGNGHCQFMSIVEGVTQTPYAHAGRYRRQQRDFVAELKKAILAAYMAQEAYECHECHDEVSHGEQGEFDKAQHFREYFTGLASSSSDPVEAIPRRLWGRTDSLRLAALVLQRRIFVFRHDIKGFHAQVYRPMTSTTPDGLVTTGGVLQFHSYYAIKEELLQELNKGQNPLLLLHTPGHYASLQFSSPEGRLQTSESVPTVKAQTGIAEFFQDTRSTVYEESKSGETHPLHADFRTLLSKLHQQEEPPFPTERLTQLLYGFTDQEQINYINHLGYEVEATCRLLRQFHEKLSGVTDFTPKSEDEFSPSQEIQWLQILDSLRKDSGAQSPETPQIVEIGSGSEFSDSNVDSAPSFSLLGGIGPKSSKESIEHASAIRLPDLVDQQAKKQETLDWLTHVIGSKATAVRTSDVGRVMKSAKCVQYIAAHPVEFTTGVAALSSQADILDSLTWTEATHWFRSLHEAIQVHFLSNIMLTSTSLQASTREWIQSLSSFENPRHRRTALQLTERWTEVQGALHQEQRELAGVLGKARHQDSVGCTQLLLLLSRRWDGQRLISTDFLRKEARDGVGKVVKAIMDDHDWSFGKEWLETQHEIHRDGSEAQRRSDPPNRS